MRLKVGIDVGGTFTDFIVAGHGREPLFHKVLSTPEDPSIAVLTGLQEIAGIIAPDTDVAAFVKRIDTIVHGTTVTTNATLTHTGAKSALITTRGVRDALEMRRGIRERQYDNRYTNVSPLVARYLRAGVGGRLDRDGNEVEPLSLDDIHAAIDLFRQENVEAVSICLMNSFANPEHERAAAEIVRKELPGAYLSVSSDLLPSIRFYERVSTTALNSYVGPKLNRYLDQLVDRLKVAGFNGVLLIVQSNGGVISPQLARERAALTLLSGPAGGPAAGLFYAGALDSDRCIVTDMGGTSFEASAVVGAPLTVNDGEISRHKIALPMLDIHTIGAGGGSIGWLDEGGLLRMGPQSAGAAPGPACYGKGGTLPTTTDANLVLGYLDPAYFAGGKMQLDVAAARRAIEAHVARPMGLTVEEAAAGMYRVACNNMAQGVREVTIKRGFDPREFPFIAAGGAGPIHSCLICSELAIPLLIVPWSSSVLCAFGMLLSDLRHDFVRTFVSRIADLDWASLDATISQMRAEGDRLLDEERVAQERRNFVVRFDCRYVKQYHEVSVAVPWAAIERESVAEIAGAFHAEHRRLYGYSLEAEKTPIELINVRLQAIGTTEKAVYSEDPYAGLDGSHALKGERAVYIPEANKFKRVPIYDGHRLKHGARIAGPALIESVTTAIFVSADYDGVVDRYRSFVVYLKGHEHLARSCLQAEPEKAFA
ncbi:hydantoinase/oxoprolinase family protein [Bradyrhizobium sp.]|uniref:hydantoinase/oxoprolinase family protein n=1 Tax=Bradyrhizobium sp. TaxID=376 RepID=UPI00239B30DC|nr:hydantoinase/oxoprolinase family protein [Bradyrhizobium sp.]MDE2378089.1 hydantoinase/oxoprolinase family protein [Bradyrhizobium sp.]